VIKIDTISNEIDTISAHTCLDAVRRVIMLIADVGF
jgi:hypothetical protein